MPAGDAAGADVADVGQLRGQFPVLACTPTAEVDSTAAQRLAEVLSPATIDSLIKAANSSATPLDGVDGLLNQITKAVFDRALQAEMTEHLGYEVGDPAGRGTGNSLCLPAPVSSVPALSLEPVFRRSHGSLYKALARGRIDPGSAA